MATTPDFRARCAELLQECQNLDNNIWRNLELWNAARADLATPPPEPPTEDELMALAVAVFEDPCATDKDYARAVLERWGN